MPDLLLLERPALATSFAHTYETSGFVRGPKERNLRVVVDLPRVPPSPALDALLSIGRHKAVELLTTDPQVRPTIELDLEALRNKSGWPVAIRRDDSDAKALWAVWDDSALIFAQRYAQATGEPVADAEHRFVLAAAVARRADALVLSSPTAIEPAGLRARSNLVSPEAAVALCGLFLRFRDEGEVEIWPEGDRQSVGLGTQYFATARSLMPAGWRWFSACARADRAADVIGKGEAVLQRFPRCIRARDEILWRAFNPVRQSDQDGILFYADAFLLMLGGCFDATAGVADIVYSMGSRPESIGWRRKEWRRSLRSCAPDLENVTSRGTPVRAIIDLVAAARNTIHGDPLRGIESAMGSEEGRHLIDVPPRAADALAECASILGGSETWAALDEAAHLRMLDPVPFFQALIPLAAAALDAILAATNVTLLPGVVEDDLLTPDAAGDDLFGPAMSTRLRFLLGL